MQEDAVWEALARALAGEYDIVARLGLGSGAAPVYLARESITDTMVALRLPPLVSDSEAREFGIEVVRHIDASLPEIEARCSHCGEVLRQWSRFCAHCGQDVSGMSPSDAGKTRDGLRQLVADTATGKYDILGEMSRVAGGGIVYFGRDVMTGQVVGLQLEAGPDAKVQIKPTLFAPSDPTIQIPEARRPSDDQVARRAARESTGKRVSVPRYLVGDAPSPRPTPSTGVRRRNAVRFGLVTSAIIALILIGLLIYRLM
jgi:hypothetical protein